MKIIIDEMKNFPNFFNSHTKARDDDNVVLEIIHCWVWDLCMSLSYKQQYTALSVSSVINELVDDSIIFREKITYFLLFHLFLFFH